MTAAALQYVRKVGGTTKPSQANQAAFDRAVARSPTHPAPARRPGHHRPAQGPRGRGRQAAGAGRGAVRPMTAVPVVVRDEAAHRRRVGGGSVTNYRAGARPAAGPAAGRAHRRRAVDRLRDPRLPRAGLAAAAADDLPGVRGRPGGAAALLGARPPGSAGSPSPRPTPATGRSPRLDPDLLITQNVDGLHEEAGSRRLVALHGRIADVVCLDCRRPRRAAALEQRLADLNPGWRRAARRLALRPDGDVDLDDADDFVVAGCVDCGGRAEARRGVLRRERPGPTGSAAATPRSTRWPAPAGRCWWPGPR